MKIKPDQADQGDYLVLQPSWTKGGKEHRIKIRNEAQRAALDHAKRIAGKSSLIPSHLSYVQQLRRYEYFTAKYGIRKPHGLRHQFAQKLYSELTGFLPPICGGPHRRNLIGIDKAKDLYARKIISRELGHERISITYVYLGS